MLVRDKDDKNFLGIAYAGFIYSFIIFLKNKNNVSFTQNNEVFLVYSLVFYVSHSLRYIKESFGNWGILVWGIFLDTLGVQDGHGRSYFDVLVLWGRAKVEDWRYLLQSNPPLGDVKLSAGRAAKLETLNIPESWERGGLLVEMCLFSGNMKIGFGTPVIFVTSSVIELHERVKNGRSRWFFARKSSSIVGQSGPRSCRGV